MQIPMFRNVNRSAPWLVALLAIGVVGTATTAYLKVQTTTSQTEIAELTIPVVSKNLTVQIKGNGVVQAVQRTNLSPKNPGQVVQLHVDEGDWVKQGDIIARMDSGQSQAQVNQFKAALARTEAELTQKRAGTRQEEITQAKARLAQLEARLAQLRSGSRPEEIAQARAKVEDAQAQVELTQLQLRRYQSLANQQAIKRSELDERITEDRRAQATLREAQQRLAELKNGTRPEEIAQAEAQVAEARSELTQLQNGTRPEEIAQAEAQVAEARAQLQYYETQLDDNLIRAPFSGLITRRYAQVGDFVTPTTTASSSDGATSTSIAELSSGLEVEGKVPEANIAQIKAGQQVEVRADAYPDEVFKGTVKLIAPRAVKENNVTFFRVKVALQPGQDELKSGMNVKLAFLGNQIENAVTVPLAAVVTKNDGQTGVLVPDAKGQAQFRPVTLGATAGDQIQILEGVKARERIFISPPPGQKVDGVDTLNL
ncbi:MAG: efflux RND transporter periplasmic adaptor subunit [Coleofasciculus sp. S288]|nr:efflux RND transporter periplasmic adaptor subunit [Coleofasciculus sp. S288]